MIWAVSRQIRRRKEDLKIEQMQKYGDPYTGKLVQIPLIDEKIFAVEPLQNAQNQLQLPHRDL